MKRLAVVLIGCVFFSLNVFSGSGDLEPFKLKGFFLGMDKNDVQKVFQKLKSEEVAKYISMESSDFRDLIQLDNEFSSMGNKIELNYDESGKVTYIKFQYKASAILFNAGEMSAEEFVDKFSEEFGIPEMEFKDMGMVKTWSYSDEVRKFSLTVDDYMNITLKTL